MAYHGVLIPDSIAAKDIDAWTRPAIAAFDVDNGNIVIMNGLSATAGESEVFNVIVPSTGNGLTGVWMAYEPELVWTSSYRGLDPNVRNFYSASGKTFTVFKPQLGDIFTITGEALYGSKAANEYLNATNTAGKQLAWAATAGSNIFAAKLLKTTYLSLGSGEIDTQRVTAYQFQVVAL